MVTCPNGVKVTAFCVKSVSLSKMYPSSCQRGSFNAEALLTLPGRYYHQRRILSSEEEKAKLDKLGIPYLVSAYGNMAEQDVMLSHDPVQRPAGKYQ